MIYLIMNEELVKNTILPPVILFQSYGIDRIPRDLRYGADYIFEFENGKTVYLKDRNGTDYQYTSEEMVVLRLKSVLL
jgi:hypothetical protein